MVARAARPLLVLVLLARAAAPAFAQGAVDRFIGRPVAEIRVEVEGQSQSDSSLLALVVMRVGEPLTVAAIRETIDHFGALSRFDDVQLLVEESAAGLVLTVSLEPRHPIDRLRFTGQLGLPAGDLERTVRALFGGLPPATANLRSIEQALERALGDEGFLTARASAVTEPNHDLDRATLVVAIEAGPRARIAMVTIENDSPLSAREIQNLTGAVAGQPYRPRALATALASLRDDLSRRAYYLAFANQQVDESADPSAVDLTLSVGAGPRIRVEWAGDPRPGGRVEDLVPIQREGSADEDLLEDTDRIIRTALQREGYRNASVFHSREERGDDRVITFHVTRGRRFRLSRVELPPALHVDAETIQDALGLTAGEPIVDDRVQQGISRVLLEYQRQGYYKVEAVAESFEETPRSTPAEAWLVLRPAITEGPRVLVDAVALEFADGPSRLPEAELRAEMRSRTGEPFSVAAVYFDRLDLEALYRNQGFRDATIVVQEPEFSTDEAQVDLAFRITEGPQTVVGEITVVGNRRVLAQTILDRITLRPEQPLGPAALTESRRRLTELGISRATFSEQQRSPGDHQAHVILSVEEAPATTFGFGGGVEVLNRTRSVAGQGIEDVLEAAPRGFVEISRRHIGGRDRTISAFGRVSLKRASIKDEDSGSPFGFIEYRTTLTYRERRVFRTDAELLFGVTSEQATRTTFNFLRRAVNAELLRRVTPTLAVTGRYALEFTKLFDEIIPPADQPAIDRLFPQVRLSILSTGAVWDRRDSPVGASRGELVTADVETALTGIGSEVDYVKTFLQFLRLTPLTDTGRFVLATRAQLGLARARERTVEVPDSDPPVTEAIDDLPASQRFFAGGSTTVRGFQLDRLGVPEILNADGLSNGGNALVIFNAELRGTIGRLFGREFAAVGFVDAGNVFRRAGDIDLGRLRGTTGFGVRWDSPLGPLRLDAGFKLDPRFLGERRERRWELHLSIGEAF